MYKSMRFTADQFCISISLTMSPHEKGVRFTSIPFGKSPLIFILSLYSRFVFICTKVNGPELNKHSLESEQTRQWERERAQWFRMTKNPEVNSRLLARLFAHITYSLCSHTLLCSLFPRKKVNNYMTIYAVFFSVLKQSESERKSLG